MSCLLYPKNTPSAFIESFPQFISEKLSPLFLPLLNHNPSVFSLLSFKPETLPNSFISFSQFSTACSFFRKTVMSSASCVTCIYFLSFLKLISRPSLVFFRIRLPKISTTRRKSRKLKGQPCRMPLCISTGLEVQPLLERQDSALL